MNFRDPPSLAGKESSASSLSCKRSSQRPTSKRYKAQYNYSLSLKTLVLVPRPFTLDYSVFLHFSLWVQTLRAFLGWCGWPEPLDFKSSLNPSSSAIQSSACFLFLYHLTVGSCFHLLCPQSSLCYSGDLFTPGSSTAISISFSLV